MRNNIKIILACAISIMTVVWTLVLFALQLTEVFHRSTKEGMIGLGCFVWILLLVWSFNTLARWK